MTDIKERLRKNYQTVVKDGESITIDFNDMQEADDRIEELEAEVKILRKQRDDALDHCQKLRAVVDAAVKLKGELEEAEEYHSSCCMNCTFLEHSYYQCGQCDLREALAQLEADDE